MKWAHLVFGVLVFVVFTITGRYMRIDFPDKYMIPQELRLLMRSRHIYILFSAMLHLLLGAYLIMRPESWRQISQYLGSAFLFVSSALLLQAFIVETYQYGHFTDMSRFGIYTSLAGIGLHLVGGVRARTTG